MQGMETEMTKKMMVTFDGGDDCCIWRAAWV